jgi:hypothetical protein
VVIWSRLDWGFWLDFWNGVQRRGVRVSPPEIGSRDGECCFGGIYWFYAVLRRESEWGNWDLGFFGVLGGDPRGACEEGGPFMWQFVYLGEFLVLNWVVTPYDVCRCGLAFEWRGFS